MEIENKIYTIAEMKEREIFTADYSFMDKFRRDDFKQYFPPKYTDEQMKRDIIKGLELLKRQRERNRDAR